MKIITTRYKVDSDRIPKCFDGFRIAVLSDLHDTVYGKDNELLFEKINNENPDVIFIAGDLITGIKDRDYSPAIILLKKLAERYSVYYGFGNHEVRGAESIKGYRELIKEIEGVRVLDNEKAVIEKRSAEKTERLVIAGLTLDRRFYSKKRKVVMSEPYIESKIGRKTDDYTVLLAHHPDYFEAYAEWDADMVFSGHLHGGLVRLPFVGGVLSPQISFFPKYDKGQFKKNNTTMIVSAGLGTHTIPRIFNPAELVIVEIFNVEKNTKV